ncbi:MAG: DUF6134 family protein [Pelagibacteraceae bacterium]|jgi:hypothetical protein
MKKKFLSIILLSFLSVSAFSHNEHYTNLNSLEYDLYRNDELIGYHNYFFKKEGINLKVSSILDIKINKLGIDLYKYNLESIEEYEGDQLVKYSSKTQQNKKTKMTNIELDKKNDKLIISGTENQLISPKEYPVGTWWNHEIIQSKAQISAISGRIIEQRVTFLGKEKLNLYGKTYDALRFNFSSSDENLPEKKRMNTDIWYDEKTHIWLKAGFEQTGYWEYRLKSYN